MIKAFVVAGIMGILTGCGLGIWLAWQHDSLVQFVLVTPSLVGLNGLHFPVVLGILFGLAVSWCAQLLIDETGPRTWAPVALSLAVALAACSILSYLVRAALPLQLLGVVLLVFTAVALAAAAIRLRLAS
jgi:hypothetical protein